MTSRLRAWRSFVLTLLIITIAVAGIWRFVARGSHKGVRLYWFVPDGLRAEPDLFTLYEWARAGRLPNIKRMMDEGSFGYSVPVFPSHTPVNFAALFTGATPEHNGVADGPLRFRGQPLASVTRSGFSSLAKTIDPFWFTLEKAGLAVTLLSVPGSTPPELKLGQVIKGRWGGWGIDFPSLIFHDEADQALRAQIGWNDRVFQMGAPLTLFVRSEPARAWEASVSESNGPGQEVNLRVWGQDLFLYVYASRDAGARRARVSLNKRQWIADLGEGEWSPWFDVELQPQTPAAAPKLKTHARVNIIRLKADAPFRVRVQIDGLNETLTSPSTLAQELKEAVGPMVDFVDNFPPQFIYFDEDKRAFRDEFAQSFEWHARAEDFVLRQGRSDVFIQSIYSPNQMLTGRWWMGALDPRSRHYATMKTTEREDAWADIHDLYRRVDAMIGRALDARPADGYVVLSSDHGAVPLNYEVKLNNLFRAKGWLAAKPDAQGQLRVDWANTRVVFINMNHVYINPNGLAGPYQPANGPAYQQLRGEVARALKDLKLEGSGQPLADVRTREETADWALPAERVGDLVLANAPGFNWIEDISRDGEVFSASLKTGYKQAILTEHEHGLWTPFLIVGPGIKKGHALTKPISHLDQYPTLMRALKLEPPYRPDGHVIEEVFANP